MSIVFDSPLLNNCIPPSSDLVNNLVSAVNCRWTVLLSTWPTRGLAFDLLSTLLYSPLDNKSPVPSVTMELCSPVCFPGGRIPIAAGFHDSELGEIWAFANGKRILVVFASNNKLQIDLLVQYDVKTLAIGRSSQLGLFIAYGGPRGIILQTLESNSNVICFLWRRYMIRHIAVSTKGNFLLALTATGKIGFWRLNNANNNNNSILTDESIPFFSGEIPHATMSCASISLDETYFCASVWIPNGGNRPLHFVYQVDPNRVSPVESLVPLRTQTETTRTGPSLPPAALHAFSPCGRYLSSTSSPSSFNIWEISTGISVFKWDCPLSKDVDDDIVGLTNVTLPFSQTTTIVDSMLMVRTAEGRVHVFNWPDADDIQIKHSLFKFTKAATNIQDEKDKDDEWEIVQEHTKKEIDSNEKERLTIKAMVEMKRSNDNKRIVRFRVVSIKNNVIQAISSSSSVRFLAESLPRSLYLDDAPWIKWRAYLRGVSEDLNTLVFDCLNGDCLHLHVPSGVWSIPSSSPLLEVVVDDKVVLLGAGHI